MVAIDMIEFAESTKKGSESRQDYIVEVQARLASSCFTLHLCPTCTELACGQRWQSWLDTKQEGIVTVMQWVCFEGLCEDLPVYINQRPPDAKPHWVLAQGVGPKGVELDSSRSGRIHRPTLRQYGIPNPTLSSEALADWAADLCVVADTVLATCQCNSDPAASLRTLFQAHCPLLQAWAEDEAVRQQLTAAGADQTTPTEPASSQCPAAASPVKGPASDTHGTTSHSEGKQSTQKKEVRRPNDKHAKRQALVEEVRDGLSVAQK
eukprot:GGOE01046043.1.p1 GENE.GGOE01046043.1~~GGOE01046043.1.p1  ORF type:complete len:288 (-),score=73.76 GGOE01046043.1:351-1145(-)